MSSVILSGDTSGTLTLSAPAVAGTNTATLPAATGTVMVSGNMPAFSAYSTLSQTLASGTPTKITLDTELYDTNSNFASSRFTPTVAGYYQINFTSTNSASGNNGLWLYDAIYKNGSAYIGAYSVFPSGNIQNFSNTLSQVIYMNGSSDYIEFYVNVYVPSGTPSYGGGAGTTLASGCLLRAA
jgi:hypothetical protein